MAQSIGLKTRPLRSPDDITEQNLLIPRVSPINSLPTEILSYIMLLFSLGLRDGWKRAGSKRDVVPLLRVCKTWQTVILAARELWTDIDMTYPKIIPILLKRSGEAPIHVRYISPSGPPNMTTSQLRQIWELVLSSSERVSSLEIIDLPPDLPERMDLDRDEALRQLQMLRQLENPSLLWPQLKVLKLSVLYETSDLSIFKAHTPPPLTRIVLIRTYIPLTSGAFGPWLVHLHLQYAAITIPSLLGALKRCVRLETLVLIDLGLTSYDKSWEGTIELNSLRWIDLQKMPHVEARFLLEHIQAPNTTLINLKTPLYSVIDNLSQLIPPNHHTLTRLRERTTLAFMINFNFAGVNTDATLNPEPSYLSKKAWPVRNFDSIELSLHTSTPPESLSLLCRDLGSSKTRDLTVVCSPVSAPHLQTEHWRNMLLSFPGLEVLRIRDYRHNFENVKMLLLILRALASSDESQQTIPRIRVFVFEFGGSLQNFDQLKNEIVVELQRLCNQGRKLEELRLAGLTRLDSEMAREERKERFEGLFGLYVDKLCLNCA